MEQERIKEIFLQPEQEIDSIELELVPFDAPEWECFCSAGGSDCLKSWVKRMTAGEGGAFDECCAQISHQMTFYPAIYLVFPYLVEKLASDLDKSDAQTQIMQISQLGSCLMTDCAMIRQEGCTLPEGAVSEDDTLQRLYRTRQEAPEGSILEGYQMSIRKLQLIIKRFLSMKIKSLGRADSMTRTMFSLAVLAIFGNREDAYLFMNAEMDEFIYTICGACEACDEDTLDLTSKRALSAIEPGEQAGESWDGEDLQDTQGWYGGFLELVRDKRLAGHLPYYLGTYQCPECGHEAVMREFMRNYMTMQ